MTLRLARERVLQALGLLANLATVPSAEEKKPRQPLFDSVAELKLELARLQADE